MVAEGEVNFDLLRSMLGDDVFKDEAYEFTWVGKYNPDWAIAFYEGTVKHVYFVAETKGDISSMELRKIEEAKAHCAREHFKAISGDNVVYDIVDSYDRLWELVSQ